MQRLAGAQRAGVSDQISPVKVRLIEPGAPSAHVYSKVRLPRLGLPMIGAALAQDGHDVLVYVADLAPIDWHDVYSADIVGLSATTSTVVESYRIADRLRERGIPTIIGGPHVTFMADEALRHADFVARGEGGEQLMLELIDALQGRRPFESVAGLSYKVDGVIHHNPLRPPVADLDSLPLPDLSLIRGRHRLRYTPIMTSWGCPFDCRFCSVTAMFGRRYRFRSPEHVITELAAKQPRRVFFYDDNLAADRQRLKVLLRMIIDEGLRFGWTAQVRTDVARDAELLDLMRRSGCRMVFLGLESVNQLTLDGYRKRQRVDDIVAAVRTLHRYGIRAHGMFVLGADTDGPEAVRETVSFALRHRLDAIMLNILTPLPGTPVFDDLVGEGRVLHRRWDLYDGLHVVFRPRRLSPRMLHDEIMRGYARFYNGRRWLGSLLTGRFTQLVFQTWAHGIRRSWCRDRRNREYLAALEQEVGA